MFSEFLPGPVVFRGRAIRIKVAYMKLCRFLILSIFAFSAVGNLAGEVLDRELTRTAPWNDIFSMSIIIDGTDRESLKTLMAEKDEKLSEVYNQIESSREIESPPVLDRIDPTFCSRGRQGKTYQGRESIPVEILGSRFFYSTEVAVDIEALLKERDNS